ncbi:MAG: DUF87 domain-containing protein, partial [Candidatus Lokiarchaeota archaeon]|nr:DUF87 domain-containing protein [Candidatus Lokiarchaeota archaeon]
MLTIELYFGLNFLLLIISFLFYYSRVKEINLSFLKFIIPLLIFFLILNFILNINFYIPSSISKTPDKTILVVISQFLLFISAALYIITLTYKNEDIIDLKPPSFLKSRKGCIQLGKVIDNNYKKHKFFLSLEDLEKHMFVCGSTGTGKSNFVQNFLINFEKKHRIPFLLVEFKGEYTFLKNYINDLKILKPGENFSINIFNPEGSNPEIHAERIFDILKSGQFLEESTEYSPQMQKVLVDILGAVCKNKKYQTWEGFFKACDLYLDKKQKKIPMLAQTLISIKNRIRRFSIGPLKIIFSNKYQYNIKELFERDIIIDLSSIIRLGGEKEDALFFLNMILKYLWDENLTMGAHNYNGIKHLTIVEDAQYFAPKDLTKQSKISTYLEDIALLQRGTGECLISIATRPQVSEEILANCGVLVIFKNHMEKEFQCQLLNLDEKNEHYLSILEKGQCLIRTNSVKRPFLLSIPYRERKINEFILDEMNNPNILKKPSYKFSFNRPIKQN